MSELNIILIGFFGVLLVAYIFKNSISRVDMLQYPFLATAVVLGWVFPQLIGLQITQEVLEAALTKTIIYSALCLSFAILGYNSARRPFKMSQWEMIPKRLDIAAAALMTFGSYFFYQYYSMADEAREMYGGAWTGEITIYVFLASTFKYGFILAIASNVIGKTPLNRLMIYIGFAVYILTIFGSGRRQDAVEIFVITIMYLWLKRGILPQRSIMLGALFAGILFVNTISSYRSVVLDRSVSSSTSSTYSHLANIDYVDLFFANISNPNGSLELRNAAMNIEAADRRKNFDGGMTLWNNLVLNFVPGQIVGFGTKRAMMADIEEPALEEFNYVSWPGSTPTGMSDSFRSFWYFGVMIFFLTGFIMKKWFAGIKYGSIVSAIAVMFFMPYALLAYTHFTHLFFSVFVNFAVFMLPGLYFAKKKMHLR